MRKAPAFQLFCRDFLLDDTAELSLAATGAFIKLLAHQWLAGSLPASIAQLAKLVGTTTRRFRPVWREIAAKFPFSHDGRRANPELEERRLESDAYRARQRESGLRGARARWLQQVP